MTLLIIRLKNTTTYDLRYGVGGGWRGSGGGREAGRVWVFRDGKQGKIIK